MLLPLTASGPIPLPAAFTFRDQATGASLGDVASLHNLVTVVDAASLFEQLGTVDTLIDRGWHLGAGDDRTVANLLCDQLEVQAAVCAISRCPLPHVAGPLPQEWGYRRNAFLTLSHLRLHNPPCLTCACNTRAHCPPTPQFANVLLMNKVDLLDDTQLHKVEALLRKINPTAEVVRTLYSKFDPSELLDKERFSMQKAEEHPEWLAEARENEHTPETAEYGISSFIFRAKRPFHPERLHAALGSRKRPGALSKFLRVKGIGWLASQHNQQAHAALAGTTFTMCARAHDLLHTTLAPDLISFAPPLYLLHISSLAYICPLKCPSHAGLLGPRGGRRWPRIRGPRASRTTFAPSGTRSTATARPSLCASGRSSTTPRRRLNSKSAC